MKIIKVKESFPGMERTYSIKKGDTLQDNGVTAVLNQEGRAVFEIEWEKYPNLFDVTDSDSSTQKNELVIPNVSKFLLADELINQHEIRSELEDGAELPLWAVLMIERWRNNR